MTINVKFLSEQEMEQEAQTLLDAYCHKQGRPFQIPVPVDDILETHLGLSLDLDDLQKMLGIPDVLGALCTRSVTGVCIVPIWRMLEDKLICSQTVNLNPQSSAERARLRNASSFRQTVSQHIC
jgi:hypothetical protein